MEKDNKKEIKELFKEYHKTKDKAIREKLILYHEDIVLFLIKKFLHRGEPEKDLYQVGMVGLIQAIDRFDPSRDIEFVSFATPTILGELKRYFRDKGWAVKIPRKLQELNRNVSLVVEKLTQEMKRSPTIDEIANYLQESREKILESLEISNVYNLASLDATITDSHDNSVSTLMDFAGEKDIRFENLGEKEFLKSAIHILNNIEKKIIFLRFYKNSTQIEISRELKISQMQVSRILNAALKKMRHYSKKVLE